MSPFPLVRAALPLVLTLTAAACASTGSTFGSGTGDAYLERPPFYAGRTPMPAADRDPRFGHVPVAYQRGASQAPIFDPSLGPDMLALLDDMTAFLDSLGLSARLADGGRVSAVTHAATRRPPDVHFGCVTDSLDPDDDCAERGDEALGRGPQRMRLAVGRPSEEWTAWASELMGDAGVDHTLVVTLEVGQYWIRQRGLRGTKVVELGTGHEVTFPWLTSLETPVAVLQLTGAVVGRDGRATRIGAEGLLARRTSLPLSALGAQALITDEEVAELRVARREDLPGRPLTWQVGLRSLVEQLAGTRSARVAP